MNIGIIGRARSGKDTAGRYFVDGHGYRRLAFADALKEAALKVDPIVDDGNVGYSFIAMRLSEAVGGYGWEEAKDKLPEVRRFLQELGASMRAVDPEVWIRPVLARAIEINDTGVPVIITDVRYRNEAASLVRAGFHLIHIDRPGIPQLDHESERDLGPEDARYLVRNDGDVARLGEQLERVWDEIYELECIKHANRL